MSAKSTVTKRRSSPEPVPTRADPQAMQNRARSGFSVPQLGQICIARVYGAGLHV